MAAKAKKSKKSPTRKTAPKVVARAQKSSTTISSREKAGTEVLALLFAATAVAIFLYVSFVFI